MAPVERDTSTFRVRLLGVPAAASIVRERLRAWLDGFGWPEYEADDVVLAVHEAVTNSVEHGYGGREPGEVDVTGVRILDDDGQRVRLLVHDDGRWRPPGDPGYRGRGIAVMRGCVAEVGVHPGDEGTEVVLVSRPVPVPRARGAAPMSVAVLQVRSRVRAPGETGR
ncbi:ATP-binding protein [Pseudonocardia broussonetiae]|uniref:ATP-binding protein n=1 Tax=Pseudonocardia broussonetiae TaxID=2736640 RepID=A0A6M6JGI0_9PSEU|nr:ATP-binding protein [Pseudonocardia broussonetiae]QJY47128.1 ATP-binding protein [Pseudonocardia broussonetiae]